MGAHAYRGMGAVMGTTIELDGRRLSLEQIEAIAVGGAPVSVTSEARKRVKAARDCVERQFELIGENSRVTNPSMYGFFDSASLGVVP